MAELSIDSNLSEEPGPLDKDSEIDEDPDIVDYRKSFMTQIDQSNLVARRTFQYNKYKRKSRISEFMQQSRAGQNSQSESETITSRQFTHRRNDRFKYNKRTTYVADIETPTVSQLKCAFTADPFWYMVIRGIIVTLIVWLALDPYDITDIFNGYSGILLSLHAIYAIDFVMSFIMQHLMPTPILVPNPIAKPIWIYATDFIAIFPLKYIITIPDDNKPLQVFVHCQPSILLIRLMYEYFQDSLRMETSFFWRIFEIICLSICMRVSIASFVFAINDIKWNSLHDIDWLEFKSVLFQLDIDLSVLQSDIPIIISIYLFNCWIYIPSICLFMFTNILNDSAKYSYIAHMRSFQTVLVSRYGISKESSNRIMQFLKITWETRQDFMFWEAALAERVCCETTYQAMCQDRNLYALQHCPMLKDFDYYILRYLTQLVTPKIYLKDIYLYKFPLRKLSMIYIASGEVHLLSNEDGETPIMKLTAGTCLGSIVLLRPYRATCNLRTGTSCEIFELTTRNFSNMARVFPKQYRLCLKYIQNKIDQAFILKSIKEQVEPQAIDKTIIWIKRELHRLLSMTASNPDDHKITNIYLMQHLKEDNLKDIIYTKMNINTLAIKPRDTKYNDLMFIKSSCPWVLQPNSPLLKIMWKVVFFQSIITYLIIVCGDLYGITAMLTLVHCIGIICMVIEIILLSMTPTRLGANRSIWHIFIERGMKLTFALNIISVIVSALIVTGFQTTKSVIIIILVHLRLWRIFAVYNHIEANVVNNLFAMQFIFFLCVYALLWFSSGAAAVDYDSNNTLFSYSSILQALALKFAAPNMHNLYLMPNHTLQFIVVAVLASSYHLFRNDSIQITNAITTSKRFMKSGTVQKQNVSLSWRLHSFLTYVINDYSYLQLKNQNEIFMHLPDYMAQLIKPDDLVKYMKASQFFSKFPSELIYELSLYASVETFYENALILTRGVVCNSFYILIKGQVCSVELSRVEKVLNGADLNCLEVILGVPTARHFIALSYVVVITVPYTKFINNLTKYPTTNSLFHTVIENNRDELKEDLFKISNGKPHVIIEVSQDAEITSCYIFKCVMYRDSFEAYDYFPLFDALGVFAFVRFLLMRMTFHPEGALFIRWEKFRIICICTGIIIYLIPSYIQRQIELYALFFDIIGFIDIYIRFHVCYYNDDGILIKHPLSTARHYFYRSFLVDLISVLPLQFYSDYTIFRSFVRSLRTIQLYRLFGFFRYTFAKNYLFTILGEIYLMVIIVLALATLIFELHCSSSTIYELKCPRLNEGNAATYYLTLCYMMCSDLTGIGSRGIISRKILEDQWIERFFCAALLLGIFWRALCLGRTFNTFVSNRTIGYKPCADFGKLINFMKTYNMPKYICEHVGDYFSIQWEWVGQNNIEDVLIHMNASLKRDLLFHVYGDPFIRYNHFTSDYRNLIDFYKNIFLETSCRICPTYGKFITTNDVDSLVYFIYRGSVEIKKHDNQIIANLFPGAIFGNLGEARETRQLISATAKCNTQCLCLKSSQLFKILKFFPKIHAQYYKAIHKNYWFIKSKAKSASRYQHLNTRQQFLLYLINWLLFLHLVIVIYIGNLLNIYQLATQEDSIFFMMVLYFIDAYHIVGVLIKYVKPVRNDLGFWCTRINDIYKVNGSIYEIAVDIITAVPIPYQYNRLLRVYYNFKEYYYLLSLYETNYKKLFRKAFVIWYAVIYFSACATAILIVVDVYVPGHLFDNQKRVDLDVTQMKDLWKMSSKDKLLAFIMYFRVVTETVVMEESEYNETESVIRQTVLSVIIFLCFAMQLILVCHFYGVLYTVYSREAFIGTIMFNKMLAYSKSYTTYMKNKVIQNARFVYSWDHKHSCRAIKSPTIPTYLRELVFNSCFGKYLFQNPLFKHCNPDFLRQVGRGFKLVDIPKGLEVIHKHDQRRCMFFVVQGAVVALEKDDDIIENYKYLLNPGDCFCFRLGLNQAKQAKYTFTCRRNSTILELEYESWAEIVPFFKATAEILLKAGAQYKHEPFITLNFPKTFVRIKKEAKQSATSPSIRNWFPKALFTNANIRQSSRR